MRGWVAFAVLMLAAACSQPNAAPQERDVTIAGFATPPIQEGTPTVLSESHGELCLSIQARNRPELRELQAAMEVRVPRIGVDWDDEYFVMLNGRLSGLGHYGFRGLCSREFVVEEVLALRPMTSEERHAQCIMRRPSCLMSIPEGDQHFCECEATEEEGPEAAPESAPQTPAAAATSP
jgi:hypothetical protein